jgi:hypothetical protein
MRQRAKPRIGECDFLAPGIGAGQYLFENVKEVTDLVVRTADGIGIVGADVGGAQQDLFVIERIDETGAEIVSLEVKHPVAQLASNVGPAHHQMRAARATDQLALNAETLVGFINPGTGTIDDQLGPHPDSCIGNLVTQPHLAVDHALQRQIGNGKACWAISLRIFHQFQREPFGMGQARIIILRDGTNAAR